MKGITKFLVTLSFILLVFSNIYAYNLNYSAIKAKDNDGNTVLKVKMSAGASDTSISNWKDIQNNYQNLKNQGKIDSQGFYLGNDAGNGCGGRGDYDSTYTTFHKLNELTTTYYNSPNGLSDYVRINYLKDNGSYGVSYISTSQNGNTKIPSFARFNTDDVSYGYKVENGTQTFIRQFNQSHIDMIYKTFSLKKTQVQKLRMSTIGCTSDDRFENYPYPRYMDTTWKYYATIKGTWFTYTYGYGHVDGNGGWEVGGNYIDAKNCTANEYDNIVSFPVVAEDPTVVYIRHKDENGNTLDVHEDERKLTDNTPLKNLGKDGNYTEKYEIPRNKTLQSDYVGQYVQVGDKVYEFVQSYYGESTESKDKAIKDLKTRGTDHKLGVSDTGKKKYVVVEYEYKPVPTYEKDYPVNNKAGAYTTLSLEGLITNGNNNITVGTPTSSSNTFCTTGDGDEDKSVLYVPASEKVKLNVEAQKFFYRHITQKPYVLNKQLKWKLIVEMYVLKDNTMRAKNSDESGTAFFGNTNNNVVSAASPYTLKDTPPFKIDDTLNDARTYINKNLEKYVGSTNFKIDSLQQLTKKSAGTKTAESDYLDIASTRYNGIRVVSGDSSYKKYVFTITKDDKSVNTNNTVDNNSDVTLDTNSTRINLYTPLVVENVKIKAEGDTIINHSDSKDVTQIQKGSKFTINPTDGSSSGYPGASANIDTSKYAKEYKLVFDFDVNDKPAGTVFPVGRGQIFEGTVTGDIFQQNNSFKIMGVTINEPTIQEYVSKTQQVFDDEMKSTDMSSSLSKTSIEQTTTKYQYKKYIDKGRIGQIGVNSNACGQNTYLNFDDITDLKEGSFYRVVYKKQTINIGRIYGFRVTDCSDINWKDVFRTSEDGSVNGITGTIYFSGNKVYDYLSNQMTNATDLNGKTYIIPLGAYKHTNKTYIQAPKLGYRISFDLKTSGYYDYQKEAANAKRYIKITPSYYFIRKDGTGYTEDIKLYYKNSSGKYSQISSSNYSISFIPKDGYRHIYDNNTSYQFNTDIMSDKLRNIAVSQAFELISGNGGNNKGMMAIDNSNNDSVQVWFGEYKLPNSTIAVKQEDGKYNINNPLNDGYIGVKFDIQCIDEQSTGTVTLSYNKNNQSSTAPNTTQWDYDQYLGYTGLGREFSGDIPIQLEKGVWHINSQAEWDKIRGTVILYDADNRAANDFE